MDMKEVMKGCKNQIERISFLNDNCDKVVEKSYSKPFNPEELQQYKEELVQVCDKIDTIEEEKKASAKEFKLMLDPLQEQRKSMIGIIRSKAKIVTENCYQFTDRETRITEFYNNEGDLIEARPATADELQLNMFQGVQMRPVGVTDNKPTGTEGK